MQLSNGQTTTNNLMQLFNGQNSQLPVFHLYWHPFHCSYLSFLQTTALSLQQQQRQQRWQQTHFCVRIQLFSRNELLHTLAHNVACNMPCIAANGLPVVKIPKHDSLYICSISISNRRGQRLCRAGPKLQHTVFIGETNNACNCVDYTQ